MPTAPTPAPKEKRPKRKRGRPRNETIYYAMEIKDWASMHIATGTGRTMTSGSYTCGAFFSGHPKSKRM
jgi:hypothetical protein